MGAISSPERCITINVRFVTSQRSEGLTFEPRQKSEIKHTSVFLLSGKLHQSWTLSGNAVNQNNFISITHTKEIWGRTPGPVTEINRIKKTTEGKAA